MYAEHTRAVDDDVPACNIYARDPLVLECSHLLTFSSRKSLLRRRVSAFRLRNVGVTARPPFCHRNTRASLVTRDLEIVAADDRSLDQSIRINSRTFTAPRCRACLLYKHRRVINARSSIFQAGECLRLKKAGCVSLFPL